MAHETSQRALRAALPPLFAGFFFLALSVGLWAWPSQPELVSRAAPILGGVLGAVGSGLVLVAALTLARIRLAGRPVPPFSIFFALWLGELALRLWTLASDSDPFGLLAARLPLAALALTAMAAGMLRVWPRGRTWSLTRGLFLLQLVGLLWIALLGAPGGDASPTLRSLAWIGFVLPYAHLIVSLRRTVRWVTAKESVAEILAS
jgi:hypothetical protein